MRFFPFFAGASDAIALQSSFANLDRSVQGRYSQVWTVRWVLPGGPVRPGRVSEWLKELVLKTSVPKGTVGSNPTPTV